MEMRHLALLLLLGCPKADPVADGGAASSGSVAPGSSNVTLAPIDDTAVTATPSVTATPTFAPHATAMTTGTGIPMGLPTGTLRPPGTASGAPPAGGATQFRACCNALRKQAQQQPAQAVQLTQAASMCDGLVAAMGNTGAAPQLEQLTPLLQGMPLPPVCQK
jgi:hypothetical protein